MLAYKSQEQLRWWEIKSVRLLNTGTCLCLWVSMPKTWCWTCNFPRWRCQKACWKSKPRLFDDLNFICIDIWVIWFLRLLIGSAANHLMIWSDVIQWKDGENNYNTQQQMVGITAEAPAFKVPHLTCWLGWSGFEDMLFPSRCRRWWIRVVFGGRDVGGSRRSYQRLL